MAGANHLIKTGKLEVLLFIIVLCSSSIHYWVNNFFSIWHVLELLVWKCGEWFMWLEMLGKFGVLPRRLSAWLGFSVRIGIVIKVMGSIILFVLLPSSCCIVLYWLPPLSTHTWYNYVECMDCTVESVRCSWLWNYPRGLPRLFPRMSTSSSLCIYWRDLSCLTCFVMYLSHLLYHIYDCCVITVNCFPLFPIIMQPSFLDYSWLYIFRIVFWIILDQPPGIWPYKPFITFFS